MSERKSQLSDSLTLSAHEAALILNKPVRTIQDWCARGELPATKISGTWIINTSKLAALLDL